MAFNSFVAAATMVVILLAAAGVFDGDRRGGDAPAAVDAQRWERSGVDPLFPEGGTTPG